jgi:hypothetical protein
VHIPAGFHFAINIDIAMFRVYSSRYGMAHRAAHQMSAVPAVQQAKSLPGCETSLSISQPLQEEAGTAATALDASPLLVQVSPDYFLSATVRGGNTVALSVVEVNRVMFTAATTSATLMSAADSDWLLAGQTSTPLVSAWVVSVPDGGVSSVLLSSAAGRLLLVTVKVTKAGDMAIDSTQQVALPEPLAGAALFDLTALPLDSCTTQGATFCGQVVTGTSDVDGLIISTLALTSQSESLLEGSTAVAVPSAGAITSARLAHLEQDSTVQTLFFVAQGLTVYAAEWTADFSTPVWSTISVGKNLQVSVAGSGAAQALMLVTDYGYCYNSHQHNTRAYPTVCASTPVPTQTVLDYSLGLARHWLEALRSGASGLNSSPKDAHTTYLATSCSGKILHGSYDQGGRPAVVLTYSPVPSFATNATGDMYFFLEAHEGVPTSTAVVVRDGVRSRGGGECGDPIHRDGVVLDAFAVDSWLRALQRVYPE